MEDPWDPPTALRWGPCTPILGILPSLPALHLYAHVTCSGQHLRHACPCHSHSPPCSAMSPHMDTVQPHEGHHSARAQEVRAGEASYPGLAPAGTMLNPAGPLSAHVQGPEEAGEDPQLSWPLSIAQHPSPSPTIHSRWRQRPGHQVSAPPHPQTLVKV